MGSASQRAAIVRRKPFKYVSGEPWWQTLGLRRYTGDSWRGQLEHIASETSRVLRLHGLDPDLESVRGDQQHQLVQECYEAYHIARRCLDDSDAALQGYRLAQIWDGQALAAVAGPALLSQQREAITRSKGRRKANQDRRDEADAALLALFSAWQEKVRAALTVNGKLVPASDRVRKFIATGKIRADRKKRRIHALLKAGKIPDLP